MRTTLIFLALTTLANAATPKQIERATENVRVAQCKLAWLQSGDTNRLNVYKFMADCLGRN